MPSPGDEAKGTVTLRSNNPRDVPNIDFNYFAGKSGPRDLQALTSGGELAFRLFNETSAPWSPFTIIDYAPDHDLSQEIKDTVFGHHASGTCRMGQVGDPKTCVDSKYRVQGVKGLRVVDASVFPRAPGAWPTVPTYMMGVRAGDLLSQDAGGY